MSTSVPLTGTIVRLKNNALTNLALSPANVVLDTAEWTIAGAPVSNGT